MNKIFLFVAMLFAYSVCKSQTLKQLDLKSFKITIPSEWVYVKHQGTDSFVGEIKTPKSSLSFDCSNQGYANNLELSEEEYLDSDDWMRECYFCKSGVTYISSGDPKKSKIEEMKKRRITDSSLVKVEIDPNQEMTTEIHHITAKQQKKYPKADYLATLRYRQQTKYVPITIPKTIKKHTIERDTTDRYIIKIISPKVPGNGMTGIYVHSRSSYFSFQMHGENLSAQDQAAALKAFKTITFSK